MGAPVVGRTHEPGGRTEGKRRCSSTPSTPPPSTLTLIMVMLTCRSLTGEERRERGRDIEGERVRQGEREKERQEKTTRSSVKTVDKLVAQ